MTSNELLDMIYIRLMEEVRHNPKDMIELPSQKMFYELSSVESIIEHVILAIGRQLKDE